MNGKIVKLEYISPRCVACGRDLPAGRKQRCFYCLPPRAWRKSEQAGAVQPEPVQEYTLADRAAQAEAYGLSYGQFMAHIENGWKLPQLRAPVRWPMDSAHWGELC